MAEKNKLSRIGIFGFLLLLLALIAAFYKVHNWHFLAAIGAWLFFDYLASLKTEDTALQLLIRNKKAFLNLYLIMFFLGSTIEIMGRFILQYWSYPFITSPIFEFFILLYYPFVLFSFRELFVALTRATGRKSMAFAIAMLIGILLWQVAPLFSGDWEYLIPIYSSVRLFNLHFFFLIGSALLVLIPSYIYKAIFRMKE